MNVMHPRTRSLTTGRSAGLAVVCALALVAACAEGQPPGGGGGQLGGGDERADAGGFDPGPGPTADAGASLSDADIEPAPDAEPPASGFERITISQHQSDELGPGFGCVLPDGDDGPIIATKQNHYYRVFDLSSHGISSDFIVEDLRIGISLSESSTDEHPVTLRIGSQPSPGAPEPEVADVEEAGFFVRDGEARFVRFDGNNTIIPAGQALYVELEVEDGEAEDPDDHRIFFLATNEEGEDAPSYFSSPDCGGLPLRTFAEHGFDRSWVVEVIGVHQP